MKLLLEGLRAIVRKTSEMAFGEAQEKFFYSALPTGMGKTTAICAAVEELCDNPAYRDVGVLILVNELRQIDTLIREMGLRSDQYAIHVGKANVLMNGSGTCTDLKPSEWPAARRRAQVLFVTQQKLPRLPVYNRNLGKLFPYHVDKLSVPRRVRIWDEAIIPAEAFVITARDIEDFLGKLFARGHTGAAVCLRKWLNSVTSSPTPHPVTTVPNFLHGINWSDEDFDDDVLTDRTPAANLYWLQDKEVRIHRDEHSGTVMLSFRAHLPVDCAPMLILDASGEHRLVYRLWEKGRGGMEPLPSPRKSYRNLTIHHWNQSAGKAAYRNTQTIDDLASGVVAALKAIPSGDPLLILFHKQGVSTDYKNGGVKPCQDLESSIRKKAKAWGGAAAEARLHFVSWGRHLASNEHTEIKHVCVVGLLQYSRPMNHAMYRAALGADPSQRVSDDEINDFRLGEVKHHLYQGVGRGSVRKAKGDDCIEGCTLFLIYSAYKNEWHIPRSAVADCFPGAEIHDWEPLGVALKGGNLKTKARPKLFAQLLAREGQSFSIKDLADEPMLSHMSSQVIARLLKDKHLIRALAKEGLVLTSELVKDNQGMALVYRLETADG